MMSYFKLMFLCILILCFVRVEAFINAQTNTDDRILCPTPILPTTETIPPDFQYITYLYPSFGNDYRYVQDRIIQLSADGLVEIPTPFLIDEAIGERRLSPDGRLLAYLPDIERGNNRLTVWDTVTDDIATIELTESEIDGIKIDEIASVSLTRLQFYQRRIGCSDNNTLVIRYLDSQGFNVEKSVFFYIETDPLGIQRQNEILYSEIDFPFVTESNIHSVHLSPDNRYAVVFENYDIPETFVSFRFVVYDIITETIIVDVVPNLDFEIYSSVPIWSNNQVYVFGGTNRQRKLARISLADGTIDMSLHDRMQEFFENDINVGSGIITLVEGDLILTRTGGTPIDNSMPQSEYYVVYDTSSDSMSMYCVVHERKTGIELPFITPDGAYIGAMIDNVRLFVIDTLTGETYRLPFHNFAEFPGWGHPSYDAQSAPD